MIKDRVMNRVRFGIGMGGCGTFRLTRRLLLLTLILALLWLLLFLLLFALWLGRVLVGSLLGLLGLGRHVVAELRLTLGQKT
jgi:hypothetical protein